MRNKRGITSILFAIVTIFIVGILLFFANHLNDSIYTALGDRFNETDKYNTTEILGPLQDIQDAENSVWDYGFLGIVLLLFLVLFITSFSTRISIAFFWIYGVLSLVVLTLGVILSNIWQDLADESVFATTITRFPITDAILGSYYPTLAAGVAIVVMILLFGKRAEGT